MNNRPKAKAANAKKKADMPNILLILNFTPIITKKITGTKIKAQNINRINASITYLPLLIIILN